MKSATLPVARSCSGAPNFLFSGKVKKQHKGNKHRYQIRKLLFYPERIDYYKLDSSIVRGTIHLMGVRAEVRGSQNNMIEFVYDDIKERGYIFLVADDVVHATMVWITNGEQYNLYGPTHKSLSATTWNYMETQRVRHKTITSLVARKYEKAAKFFMSLSGGELSPAPAAKREYDEVCSTVRCLSASSSSDEESFSPPSPTQKRKAFSSSNGGSVDLPLRDTVINTTEAGQLAEDTDGYMQFVNMASSDRTKEYESQTEPNKSDAFSHIIGREEQHKNVNILLDYHDDKMIDFGAREVNAVKMKLRGDDDFIEVNVADIGNSLDELKNLICKEFETDIDNIKCIRKLPDVKIRNDRDVLRIYPGRMLEIETNL